MWSALQSWINPRIPLILVFMSGIGFSIQTLIGKLLGDRGYHGSFECVLARSFFQLIISAYFIYFDEERRKDPENSVKLFGPTNWVKFLLSFRAAVGFTSNAFFFLAVQLLPVGDCSVLVMLSPMIASILGYVILSEPWRLPEFSATVISLIGAVLVAKPSFIFGESDSELTTKGVVFALLSALSASCGFILVRILGTTSKMPWANVSFAQSLGQMVLYFPAIWIAGQAPRYPTTSWQMGMMLVLAVIGSVSQIIMTIGMQREKSAAATGMRMSDVVFGYIWQSLFTSDSVSLLSVVGAFLVSASIFIVIIFQQKMPATKEASPGSPRSVGDVEMITTGCDVEELKKMKITEDDCILLESAASAINPILKGSRQCCGGGGGGKGYKVVRQEDNDVDSCIELSEMDVSVRNGNLEVNHEVIMNSTDEKMGGNV